MHEYYGHSQSGKTAAVNLRLCASILFLALALGRAQSSATANGSADISPARMRVLLQSIGVELTETSSSDDSAAFAFHLNGHNVKLHSQGKSIQLSACLAEHIALIKQSQWTREHFSTGAYIDEQGCASLRAEVNLGVRVTDEMIEEFIARFQRTARLRNQDCRVRAATGRQRSRRNRWRGLRYHLAHAADCRRCITLTGY